MNTYTVLSSLSNEIEWSTQSSIIMVICNLITILIGRYAIEIRGLGPSIPLYGISGFGLSELLATTSLGHIIGAGSILGLKGIGLIN